MNDSPGTDEVGEQSDAAPLADPDAVEEALLGRRTFTRAQVADKAGVPQERAEELWAHMGFAHAAEDDVAFTKQDVKALRRAHELIQLGVLDDDSRAALVRTWGRSFARLAEWQVDLLAGLAADDDDPEGKLSDLMAVAVPSVEQLQAYVWRRHLAGAANRLLAEQDVGATTQAVCFVDIVGYSSQSRELSDAELVEWIEHFESTLTQLVVEHRGRVIKTIGDEVLFVTDDPADAAEVALTATALGEDADDPFPRVRAGFAYGEVVARLGDVFGPTVNVAARLTSVARPGAVLADRRAMEELSEPEDSAIRFRRLMRRPVKGYKRLEPWLVRRTAD